MNVSFPRTDVFSVGVALTPNHLVLTDWAGRWHWWSDRKQTEIHAFLQRIQIRPILTADKEIRQNNIQI